jgi:hypothetical protein
LRPLGETQDSDVYARSVTDGQMLDEPDWDIFYWSVEKKEPPPRWKGSALLEA